MTIATFAFWFIVQSVGVYSNNYCSQWEVLANAENIANEMKWNECHWEGRYYILSSSISACWFTVKIILQNLIKEIIKIIISLY